jgi:LL-H family phage holin
MLIVENPWVKIAMDVLAVLIPALVALFMEYLRRQLGTEKLKQIQNELVLKQDLAILAVKFIEEAFKQLKGEEKYEQAAIWLSAQLKQYNIVVAPEELRGLIESALRSLKDEFGNTWAHTAQEDTTQG